jgi:hypothetical protein
MSNNDTDPTAITEQEVAEAIAKDEALENPNPIEEKPAELPSKEEEASSEEESSEEESSDELSDDYDEESTANDSKQIPLAKFQKEKKKWKQQITDLQTEFEALKSKPAYEDTTANNAEVIAKLSEKYNVNADFLKELYGILPKTSINQDDAAILREIKEERKKTKQAQEQERIYNLELAKLKKDSPTLDFDLVQVDKLKDLKTKYPTTPLDILFKAHKDVLVTKPGRKTLEESSSEVIDESLDFEKMTDDQILNLSSKDYEKFVAFKSAKENIFTKRN